MNESFDDDDDDDDDAVDGDGCELMMMMMMMMVLMMMMMMMMATIDRPLVVLARWFWLRWLFMSLPLVLPVLRCATDQLLSSITLLTLIATM